MPKQTIPCFLVFSDDWGEHPSSCQHLFRNIGKQFPVLWVNTVGMRTPKLTLVDFRKAVKKMLRMFQYSAFKENSALIDKGTSCKLKLKVIQPIMMPFPIFPGMRAANRLSVVRAVRKHLSNLHMQSPIMVATAPNVCDYIGLCGERKTVYYCVDDFSTWPGFDKEYVQKLENNLIDKADVLVATSQKLYEKLIKHGKPTYLLSHGLDLELFSQLPLHEHHLLHNIPKPRVGYFGLFDERSDQNLIMEVARRMTDVSFVITGPVEADISQLKSISNIFFTGSVPYNDLPAMVKGWDACFLGYVTDVLTSTINPLKLKEYLATGKPTISTPIPEARRLSQFLDLAETAEEWEKCLRIYLAKNFTNLHSNRQAFLKKEDWSQKAEQFLGMLYTETKEKNEDCRLENEMRNEKERR